MKKPQFTLSPIFQDNMVFQAGKQIRIHGTCKKGIDINVDFLDQSIKIRTKGDQFCIELESEDYRDKGFSFTVFNKKQEVTFYNCLIGDVFLFVGGMNVKLPLKDSYHTDDYEDNTLRFADMKYGDETPQLIWNISGKTELSNLSALAYVVAKNVHTRLKNPLGIISCSGDETTLISWMSELEFKSRKNLMDFYQRNIDDKIMNLSVGFDEMISQITPHNLKGIIFYEGENDKPLVDIYELALHRLIMGYRFYFRDSDLPFIFTQIAGNGDRDSLAFSRIRMSLSDLVSDDKNIFVASAVDLGSDQSKLLIDKTVIAKRISNVILDKIFKNGKSSLSPSYYSFNAQHDNIRIFTKNNYMNLVSKSGLNLGFNYSTDGVNFQPLTDVKLVSNQIILKVSEDVKVICYGFGSMPVCDIYTDNDLPLLPFKVQL